MDKGRDRSSMVELSDDKRKYLEIGHILHPPPPPRPQPVSLLSPPSRDPPEREEWEVGGGGRTDAFAGVKLHN
jgi:hypothetical protein